MHQTTNASFHPFVLPFIIGVIIMVCILGTKYYRWLLKVEYKNPKKIIMRFFGPGFWISIKEIFLESLLHRKIFRVNVLLGLMHMIFAFFWFLLIIIGTIESKVMSRRPFNAPYDPVFLRYFDHEMATRPSYQYFSFIMDFLLLVLLIAVSFAVIKRFISIIFGMRRTTKLKLFDRIALYTLWLIFPMRFIAESFTAGIYGNGGFLTQSAGNMFALMLPIKELEISAWWMYSSVLGLFFVALPFSRYLHIPTEVLLTFLRNSGIRAGKKYDGFAAIEVNSCPRCGICIDKCQLNISKELNKVSAVYFLQSIRNNKIEEDKTFSCLLCGKCTEYCPVGIDITNQRLIQRRIAIPENQNNYSYLKIKQPKYSEVAYFAGCMSHLTPSVITAMKKIFTIMEINYTFIDEGGSVCCGRPLKLAGNDEAAKKLMLHNKELILKSDAHLLITSCPICYKTFKEDYKINIEIKHHTQYLYELARLNKITLKPLSKTAVYHDPCELGRGTKVFYEPRLLLRRFVNLKKLLQEKHKAVCCGGSLGNFNLSVEQRERIIRDAVNVLSSPNPDCIITACPLCKKTFQKKSKIEVIDIAEITLAAIENTTSLKKQPVQKELNFYPS